MIEKLFGVSLTPALGNYQWLIIFAAVLGFGGAIVNLLISKWTAKRTYNIQLITDDVEDHTLRVVYMTVQDIALREGMNMPEVGYYDAAEVNAFATGASRDNSLVAVSTGLLEVMTDKEIAWVIGHEMTHILNGDMVTSTLLQGSLNTFTIVIARVIGWLIDGATRGNTERSSGFWYYIIVNILQTVFGFLAGLVVMAHSRHREYKADAGSVRLLGKDDMLWALKKLAQIQENPVPQDGFATLKFSSGNLFSELRASHPPIEKRIQAVERL